MSRARFLLPALLPLAAFATGPRPVELTIPLPPRLALRPGASVGFLDFRDDGAYTWVHPGKEMLNALRRDLNRAANLRLLDAPAAPLPEQEFDEIVRNASYMRRVAEKMGADYLLAGEVRYSVTDASGYYPVQRERRDGTTETVTEYQELREYKAAFDFYVFDGHSGALAGKDRFTSQMRLQQRATEDLGGFYAVYEKIRTDLLNLIVPAQRREVRYLFR